MKPQQALSNIEDYLSSFPADVIGDNAEEFETLKAAVKHLPVLVSWLERSVTEENFSLYYGEDTLNYVINLKQKLELE